MIAIQPVKAIRLIAVAFVAALFLVEVAVNVAWAQQKYKLTTAASAAQSKYVQQHMIDVGDVPDHQVRIYEIHRTGTELAFSGVKTKESWTRGSSDYVNGTGHTSGYGVWMLEDGAKVFYRYNGTSQSVIAADGSRKGTYHGVTTITGGTGKYATIRGFLRDVTKFDIQAGYNELSGEGEYWFED